MTIWQAVLFAFLGGVLLNLMPCVFPVLSLKALAVVKAAGLSLREKRIEGLLYTAGVIFHAWRSLRFQNAIWHAFVLLGAACHYTAVLDLVMSNGSVLYAEVEVDKPHALRFAESVSITLAASR